MGNLLLVFHFSMAAKLGCGNVGISRSLRDFQGAVERVGKLLLLFHAFHGPGISIASASVMRTAAAAGTPFCIAAAAATWRHSSVVPHSVSLIASASRSNSAKLRPALRYCSARSSDFSFSNGVR